MWLSLAVLIGYSLSFSLPILPPLLLHCPPFNSLTWSSTFITIVLPTPKPLPFLCSYCFFAFSSFDPLLLHFILPWDIVLTACRPHRPCCWFVRTFPSSIHSSTRPYSHDASRGRSGLSSEPWHYKGHVGRQLSAQKPEDHGRSLLHSALEDQHTSQHQAQGRVRPIKPTRGFLLLHNSDCKFWSWSTTGLLVSQQLQMVIHVNTTLFKFSLNITCNMPCQCFAVFR